MHYAKKQKTKQHRELNTNALTEPRLPQPVFNRPFISFVYYYRLVLCAPTE